MVMLDSASDATFIDLQTVNLTFGMVIFGTVRDAFAMMSAVAAI